MWLRIYAIARKEVLQILRDPRTLAVVLVMPFVMLTLYGYAIKMDVRHLRTAVLDQDRSSVARDFLRAFQHSEYFDLVRYLDRPREIDSVLDRGEVVLVVVVPRHLARDLANGREVAVQVIVDGSDPAQASIALGYMAGVVQSYSSQITLAAATAAGLPRGTVAPPLDVQPRVWYNPDLQSTNFIVPGLIAVILMMLSALLTSMTVVRERERGTLEQIVVSPIMPYELMLGKILPYVFIAFLDVILVLAAGQLLFHVPLRGSVALLLGLSLLYVLVALGLGLLISTVVGSQQTAMVMAMVGTQLPAMLLSGFVFPIMNMPPAIQALTYLIPARYFLVIIRGIFLKGVGFSYLWRDALYLLIFGVVLLLLATLRFKKRVQ